MSGVAIVLAAGKGTRMGSDRPKVLHELGGRALVEYPISAAFSAGIDRCIVVVGHEAARVEEHVNGVFGEGVEYVVQVTQNGTGHAVASALPALEGVEGPVLILSGDVPGISRETLESLIEGWTSSSAGLCFLTFRPPSAGAYGRVIRDEAGDAAAIREHADATAAEREIGECNAGVYCASAALLRTELPQIGAQNAQGEIYLTDLVERCAKGARVVALEVAPSEVAGINTAAELAALEASREA